MNGQEKAVIVAAGSVAALLALSPLAFADEAPHPTVCPAAAMPIGVGDLLGLRPPGPDVDDGAASSSPACVDDGSISRGYAP